LRMARCEVATAFDGPRGLELACGFEPEAAILDIGLPGLDGHDLAYELRRRFGPGLLLIAMSGYGQKDDVRRAFEAGFDHHLIKPVEIGTLLRLLPH
ncbi:MAG: response regulator, partial [Thermoleophilia bacterium]|nr:response regulator [Thermoleophilia bacterium]